MQPEQIDAILDAIAQGASVAAFIRENEGYSSCKFYHALANDRVLQEKYARAREAQANVYAQEIVDIADDSVLPADDRRVKIDARKWAASKLAPKKYGDKVTQEVTGEGGGPVSFKWQE